MLRRRRVTFSFAVLAVNCLVDDELPDLGLCRVCRNGRSKKNECQNGEDETSESAL